jgi:hypothetical protein
MKTHLPIGRRQSGFTYMTVVVTMIVAGVMLAAYLTMISVQNQLVERSQSWNRSVPVLEAGIEEALAHLNRNASADAAGIFNVNLASDGWQTDPAGGWSKTNGVGVDYYYVRITQFVAGNYYPFIEAEGYVKQLPAFAMRRTSGPFLAQASLVPSYTKRKVLCTTTNVPTFTKALVARKGIDMSGKNVRIDSFDSGNSLYSDGFGHYTNSPGKWRDNGDIASNDFITNTISAAGARIYGRVATGPYGTIDLGTQGSVGDIAWVDNAANKGKIKAGWSTDDMNMEFPSVIVTPAMLGWLPAPPTPPGTVIDGVTYNMVLRGSPSGGTNYYRLTPGQNLAGNIYVEGHVRLLVTDGSTINLGGSDGIKIKSGTNNTFHLFGDIQDVSIGGNGVGNDGTANQFYYFGTDKNTSLSFGGNGGFIGVIYAPNATLNLNGGGGSGTTDYSGAGIARSIKVNGNFNFHYDEALARIGLYRGYVITSWNEK